MKKGISPVISAILLIALVIGIGTIVFLWTRNILWKSEETASEEKLCAASSFIVGDLCYESISIENMETHEFEDKTHLNFNGRNDASEPELEGFMVFIDYRGRIISVSSLMYSEIEGFDSKKVTTDFIEDIGSIKEIKIVPKVREDNKIFVCEENEIIFDWEDIEPC